MSLQFDFVKLIGRLDLRLLWAGLLIQPLMLLGFVLGAVRLAILASTPAAPILLALKATILSCGFNSLLPGRVAEILKATYLRNHAGVPFSAGIAGVLVERMMDLLMVMVIGIFAIGFAVIGTGITAYVAVALTLSVILVLLSSRQSMLLALIGRLPWAFVRNSATPLLTQAFVRLTGAVTFQALFLSALIWIVAIGNVALFLALAGTIPIGVKGALFVFVACTLGAAIPALPAGLGTYEAAAVLSLSALGYGFDEALAIGLALHASQIVLSLLGALSIAAIERIGVTEAIRETVAFVRPSPKS